MSLPKIVGRDEWQKARKDLLAKEKEFTRQRDALSAARRKLPMVKVEKQYEFESPDGSLSLHDLFDGRRQLVVYHFMFDPSWTEGCKGCSFIMDNLSGNIAHLAARDTTTVAVSRAPLKTIDPFRKRMSWSVPWFSSFETDFNYDFHVTMDRDHGDYTYNYVSVPTLIAAGEHAASKGEMPGLTVFLRDGENIFHTYSTYARGLDLLIATYNVLDLTPMGRQEPPGENMGWLRHHDKYAPEVLIGLGHCCEAKT
jgi:predicted dithiol-disulfide oxidoreductase (DUF899 family)